MKRLLFIFAVATSLFATDYNSMSLEDLLKLKGTIPQEERDSFRSAMQEKTGSLSTEERQNIQNSNRGNGQMLKDGSGSGNMYKGSHGFGGNGGGGRR